MISMGPRLQARAPFVAGIVQGISGIHATATATATPEPNWPAVFKYKKGEAVLLNMGFPGRVHVVVPNPQTQKREPTQMVSNIMTVTVLLGAGLNTPLHNCLSNALPPYRTPPIWTLKRGFHRTKALHPLTRAVRFQHPQERC